MRAVTVRWLAAGAVGLGLGWGVLLAEPPPDDPRKQAQAAIVKLSDNLEAKDVGERAKQIVEQYDSCDISSVFRRQRGGGLGIGKATGAKHPDSIEGLIADFSRRKTTTEAELEQYRDDYVRVAKVMQAMAELAPYRGAPFTRGDPKRVRVTARSLEQTCGACHVLRDS